MNSFDWITQKVSELDEVSAKSELSFILVKYSEVGQQGYKNEDLIDDIRKLYLELGLNRY
ncbi:hypothetical protein SporoP8_13915 [Sporosarcina ureae]|uniref:hypothetical protein n=1 Tax=Sporosarcina ureae TaxID=1571 RepID=UPI000A150AC6|nr:hypothetical protein [Sporosarcina ureae]ARJ39876.1 hypothetical protein SporoP8_13915 [Sporosarcina ureae]